MAPEIGVKLFGSGFVAILGSRRELRIDKNGHFASEGGQNLYVFVPCFRTPQKTAKVRKKAPVFLTPDRLEAPVFRPPFGTTEGAGSGGEGFGEVPSPTEYGKEFRKDSRSSYDTPNTLAGTANSNAPRIPPGHHESWMKEAR